MLYAAPAAAVNDAKEEEGGEAAAVVGAAAVGVGATAGLPTLRRGRTAAFIFPPALFSVLQNPPSAALAVDFSFEIDEEDEVVVVTVGV